MFSFLKCRKGIEPSKLEYDMSNTVALIPLKLINLLQDCKINLVKYEVSEYYLRWDSVKSIHISGTTKQSLIKNDNKNNPYWWYESEENLQHQYSNIQKLKKRSQFQHHLITAIMTKTSYFFSWLQIGKTPRKEWQNTGWCKYLQNWENPERSYLNYINRWPRNQDS